MKLYLITVQTANSLQPRNTYWQTEVLYCGYDKEEALVAFHRSKTADCGRGYGNRCRKTVAQSKIVTGE